MHRLFLPRRLSANVWLLLLTLPTSVPSSAADDSPGNSLAIKSESFETAAIGSFQTLSSALGTWTVSEGIASIDGDHARTGKNCLHLEGGEKTSIELQLEDLTGVPAELTFWAERWTKRPPFKFTIEAESVEGWQRLYTAASESEGTESSGTESSDSSAISDNETSETEIKVGRAFLSKVRIPLTDASIRQLRFTVSSPPGTGILIDDIRLSPAEEQTIVKAEMVPTTYPILGGRSATIALVKIVTRGQLNPISCTAMSGRWSGNADSNDVASFSVHSGESPQLDHPRPASASPIEIGGGSDFEHSFAHKALQLSDGENYIWVTCTAKEDAYLDHRIGLDVQHLHFSNGNVLSVEGTASLQRFGKAIRSGGDDGVHTYRIPGLATTNQGTLIAVYDIRHRSGRDLPGDIDVGMSRSTDRGNTWEPMQTIVDMGNASEWAYDGVGDPAILVDKNTGRIWVAAVWSHGNRSWHGSQPGLTPDETGQLILVSSDDDGRTWSEPINITGQVKLPAWCFLLQGPGKGITMEDGTLVFAAQYQDSPELKRLPHSTILYSKDHGQTWAIGTGAFDDTTEAQVIESEPGVLMLNCRYNRDSTRVVMTTHDMGQTWQEHATSRKTLIEPGACMASLIDVQQETAGKSGHWLLFSNPNDLHSRKELTIKASSDRGLTWPESHWTQLDQGKSAGYSCMTMIDDETVGILYEGSQAHMTFQRLPLSEIVGPK